MNNDPLAFVHLDIHSAYSLGEGIVRVEELARRASNAGIPAVAITDTLNFYAAVKFYQACLKNGVKPLLGVDVKLGGVNGKELGRLILLCRNNSGYRSICGLLTDAYTAEDSGTNILIAKDKIDSIDILSLYITGSILIFSSIKFLNSLGDISPKPLKRVISIFLFNLLIAEILSSSV